MAYGTTIGDKALSAGMPLIAPTDNAQKGYDHHNQTRDLLAESIDELQQFVGTADRITPSYAGGRPHSFSRALALYNGESASMVTARARIARAKRGETRCRVAFIGDSRVRGAGIPLANGKRPWQTLSLPSQVREMLGARMGDIYFDPQDDRITAISGFNYTTDDFTSNFITTTGTAGSSFTFILPQACTGFDLRGFRTNTTAVASIVVDGGAPETFTPGTGASWKKFEKRGLANSNHTVTVTIPALTAGSFSFSRVEPYYGETGLTVSNAGRSSSHAGHWDETVWSALLPTLLDPNGHRPDVVVMQLGTNWGTSSYSNLASVVTKLRAAGSIVILAGFGAREEDLTDPVFNTRRGLIYDLADQFDLPLIDHVQVVGTWEIAQARALFADGVHENARGLALEAAAFCRSLAVG